MHKTLGVNVGEDRTCTDAVCSQTDTQTHRHTEQTNMHAHHNTPLSSN